MLNARLTWPVQRETLIYFLVPKTPHWRATSIGLVSSKRSVRKGIAYAQAHAEMQCVSWRPRAGLAHLACKGRSSEKSCGLVGKTPNGEDMAVSTALSSTVDGPSGFDAGPALARVEVAMRLGHLGSRCSGFIPPCGLQHLRIACGNNGVQCRSLLTTMLNAAIFAGSVASCSHPQTC